DALIGTYTVTVGPMYCRCVGLAGFVSTCSRLSAPSIRTRARYFPAGIGFCSGSGNARLLVGAEPGVIGGCGTTKSPSRRLTCCAVVTAGCTVTFTVPPTLVGPVTILGSN